MNILMKVRQAVIAHKIIASVVAIAALWGGYALYGKFTAPAAVTKYVLEKATRGTIVASVSGSGQVEPVTTIDVKPENTAIVARVYVTVGTHVRAGQALIELDTTNEAKALRQAELNLQSAELSLAKLQQAPATSTLAQTSDAVTEAAQALSVASTTLEKDYQAGFDALSTAFVDFQNVMLGLKNFVIGTDINRSQSNPDAYVNLMPNYLQAPTIPYRDNVQTRYAAASAAYTAALAAYHSASRNSDQKTLDDLFSQTYAAAKVMSDGVKAVKDLLNYVVSNYPTSPNVNPLPSITTTFQANFGTYTNTIGNDVGNTANIMSTITADENAFTNAEATLKEKQYALDELRAGPNALDIQSGQLSIEQQKLALETAQENLANDTIRAPIAGIISAVPAVAGETVASPAVSIVGEGEVAQVTLNEVDAAKVKPGDKATLTFDAIEGLSLAGQVAEIDPVGTVSQGVVNYNVKIGFVDPQNQVRPGMSVTADIVTEVRSDVVTVPNGAVVTQGGASFVLEPSSPVADAQIASSAGGGIELAAAPRRVPVTIGIANDTETEIASGVAAGDVVITRTISSGASTAAAGGTTLRLGGGLFGGGGGGVPRTGAGGR